MCLCKIFGHKGSVEVISENIKVYICKRCNSKKHVKQYIGSKLITTYDKNYKYVKEVIKK